MNIRIYNARILTMEEGNPLFKGEIHVQDNKISYVGPTLSEKELNEKVGTVVWERDVDAKGNVIMPGFKNAHTHSGMTFLRSYADDLPLHDWLQQRVFPMEAQLSEDDIYHLCKLAILEYLTSGITANFDMYLTPDAIAKASLDCGFRTVMAGGFHDHCQSIEELERCYQRYHDQEQLVQFQFGFHAEYTTSLENLEKVAALCKKYKAPVSAHNSETASEVEACIKRYGMTPTALFNRLGMFDYGGSYYHCIYMSDEDLDIMEEKDICAVTNPASNIKLASGIARIQDMLERGIRVAIGTDGPASNNCLDMFREMFLVTGLAKLREKDAAAVDACEVLKMATVNGAHAMGLVNADVLAEGKLADFIMIDLHQPNMQPLNNIVKNIVYSGSKQNVKMTVVNGQILYEDGRFYIGTSEEEIYRKANEIIQRIKG